MFTSSKLRSAAVLVVAAASATLGGLAPSSAAPAASAASGSAAWFVDPISAHGRAQEVAVPNDPSAYSGGRAHTVARMRTRAGALAVPAGWAVGHRLENGQALVLDKKAYFPFDRPEPNRAAKRQVRRLADALTNVRSVTCEGYADYGYIESHEKDLSEGRANAICRLVSKVAPQVATTTESYSSNRPVVLGGSRASRAANRRVVLVVTSAVPVPAPAAAAPAPAAQPPATSPGTPAPTCPTAPVIGRSAADPGCPTDPVCEDGAVLVDGVCELPGEICQDGEVLVDGICELPIETCEDGEILVEGVCVQDPGDCLDYRAAELPDYCYVRKP